AMKDNVKSDTTKAEYTLAPRATVTALSFVTPSRTGGSYANPDTTYGTVQPEFSVKVEGVTLGYSGTPAAAVHYQLYRFINEKDSLVDEDHKFSATFEIGSLNDPFPNDTYKIVMSVDERSAERNEKGDWEWTPFTDADGKVPELTGYFKIAAPAWTLVSPKLEVIKGEEGEDWEENEEIIPVKTGENGPRVEIKTENCEGLFGNGEDKMVIRKKVSVPSLMKNPMMFGDRGMIQNDGYVIYDTMIPADGNIVWTLPESWVDSIKKVIEAEVAAFVKEAEEDPDYTEEDVAELREQLAFKDEEDLSDCKISVQAGTLFDLSEYDMEGVMFMPSEDYPSMSIEVPFMVVNPEITVKTVGGVVSNDSLIFADGKAAFDMSVTIPDGDTTFRLEVVVRNTADVDAFPAPDFLEIKDSIRFEDIYYNGDYTISFELAQANPMAHGDYVTIMDTSIRFFVTEGADRPELTVKPVGNTMAHDTVVFANGNVAFDMLVKGLNVAEGDDSTFKFYVTVYTEDEEDYRLPQEFTYADSVRFVDVYYNGVYEAVFELMRRTPRGSYTNVTDQKFIFMVTENEEPVEKYELTVKAVDATMSGDTAWFAGKVAFDMFAGGYAEGDTLAVTIYTPAQFEDTLFIEPRMFVAAADSVRFETTLDKGTVYVAVFELLHKDSKRGENITV
ncbi:MAG: hypothetical protein K2K11_01835, partial [Bacteroidales bacterium]|nr:hypothetical protein [Bacteroidales bacterium]